MKPSILTAVGLLFVVPGLSVAQTPGVDAKTFCTRMAPQLGMQPVQRGRSDQAIGEWRVGMFSGLSKLFGGTAMVSFESSSVSETADPAEYARLNNICQQGKKSMLCRIEGPMKFVVSTGKGKAEIDAFAGERAEVEMKGTSIYCRDPGPTRRS